MPFFRRPKISEAVDPTRRASGFPPDLYTRCPVSGEMVYTKTLKDNLMVVPSSGHHFKLGAPERVASLADAGTFQEHDGGLLPSDPLGFVDRKPYRQRLDEGLRATGRADAVITGTCEIGGFPVSLAVMDPAFMAGSMGAVVGEKITRAVDRAGEGRRALIIVSNSGGARMQEGVYSLMQMAKTAGALARLDELGLPFISVLTNPTTGGVTASFATLGDVILAEPGALVGFAGPRVIQETLKSELPEDFQTAEFLLFRGLIDQVVPRPELRGRIVTLLAALFGEAPAVAVGGRTRPGGGDG